MIRRAAQNIRRFARGVIGIETFYRPELRCQRIWLGNRYAGFSVNPELLGPSSVIYSFGIGTDISFDLGCVKRFSAHVHAFDPTPRSLAWIKTQQIPPEIHVHDYGIASFDGTMTFNPPSDPTHVSYSPVDRGGEKVDCPVYRLSSIMRVLGHDHIDLLKMDIEASEYDVIPDLLADQIPIRQFCIEFHHRWPEVGRRKTDSAISALHSAGYRIFHVSPSGEEFSFIAQ
jgi:FkbM family methyltransferase